MRDLCFDGGLKFVYIIRTIENICRPFSTLLAGSNIHHWRPQEAAFSNPCTAISHQDGGLAHQAQEPGRRQITNGMEREMAMLLSPDANGLRGGIMPRILAGPQTNPWKVDLPTGLQRRQHIGIRTVHF